VEDLVSQENVIALLGPILGVTVERAAKKAQELKVPLLTLSQKETLPDKDDFVFQNSLTPSAQMETLAAFAVKELELRTLGVFYPNSPYGLHFKQLFTQEVMKRGGKVTGSVAYQEDQTDFSQEIKFFFKVRAVPKEESRQKNGVDFVSSPSVEGLFIPDTYQRVGLILQQMAYFNVKGLTFLGTNAWNHPGLLSAAGKLAEGAVFVDAFSKGDPSLATDQFVKEFRKTYGRDPETLEALGYESAELLKSILGTKMISSPSQLKEEIHRIQDFQGASGLRGFGEEGRAIRTLSILRVNKGQIEHFSP
jgi:ABC-type branched-subunit amino acid transport system substrate-binding protein